MTKTMKVMLWVGVVVMGASMLSGCDDDVPKQTQYVPAPQQQMVDEQYVNQPAPQVVQAAPAPVIVQSGGHDSGVGDFATGMILGHMMSGGGNGGGYSNNSSRTTIINNNTVAQPRSGSSYSSNTTRYYNNSGKQVYQTQSRPTMSTNSAYSAKKSYSSPMSSYSKPSRSYSSSKSFSSSRSSFSSSRRR